ncbi:CvpA family protein [Streptomyces sp. NP160]|uniref:CvpA family protein n=1 Tax=Streptomyces sp. NP160 TaxID=2586637 RepID=UPI0015D62F1B|nr:CvpA family protein [Streptomyces sp. NP160]
MTPPAPGTLLDLAVALLALAAVLFGARAGWRTGASRSVLSLAGLVGGAVVGLALSAWLVGAHLSPLVHLLLVAVCVLGGALVGAALGGAAGDLLGRGLGRLHLGLVDRTAGAGVRAVVALVVCSALAGLVLALAPPSSAVARSSVVSELADVVPQARAAVEVVPQARAAVEVVPQARAAVEVVPRARSVVDGVRTALPTGAGTSGTALGVVDAVGLTGDGTGCALTLPSVRAGLEASASGRASSATGTTGGGTSGGC